jgi:hypothetical protein
MSEKGHALIIQSRVSIELAFHESNRFKRQATNDVNQVIEVFFNGENLSEGNVNYFFFYRKKNTFFFQTQKAMSNY